MTSNNDDVKSVLKRGRARYDNALFEIEKIWNKLKPDEYIKREKIIKAAIDMVKIDKELKGLESKLNK